MKIGSHFLTAYFLIIHLKYDYSYYIFTQLSEVIIPNV